jgi:SNF2 family DNA or RNA helicase
MNYKTKPYEHQIKALEISKNEKAFGILAEMGLGKTKISIDNFNYLYEGGKVVGMLVVAPKSVYRTWVDQVKQHFYQDIYSIAIYESGMGKRKQESLDYVIENQTGSPKILLINTEATRTKKGFTAARRFLEKNKSMMVVDESSEIKTHNSKQTVACTNLGGLALYRRILTGTPITKDPLDLYAQFEFLQQGCTGSPNYYAFKYTYAKIVKVDLGPGRPSFEKVESFQNLRQLQHNINPYCIRLLKRDCIDLPSKTFSEREVTMSKEQQKHYDDVKNLAITEHKRGELTVQSALATLQKLHQITSGHLKLDNGYTVRLKNAKLEELKKVLGELEQNTKVVIWCAFQEDVRILREALPNSVTYFGEDSAQKRESAIKEFQYGNALYFISTQSCGGMGLTLVAAHYAIYYANNDNLKHRLQSLDRIHRIGQEKNVHYIDLICPGCVDEKIKKNNDKKAVLAEGSMENIQRIKSLEELIEEDPEELLAMI